MLRRQRVETVAHAVELLSFVQDRIGMEVYAVFRWVAKEKTLQVNFLVKIT